MQTLEMKELASYKVVLLCKFHFGRNQIIKNVSLKLSNISDVLFYKLQVRSYCMDGKFCRLNFCGLERFVASYF